MDLSVDYVKVVTQLYKPLKMHGLLEKRIQLWHIWFEVLYTHLMAMRADLNFEVDFGVNGAIGTIVTKWDILLYSDNESFSSLI